MTRKLRDLLNLFEVFPMTRLLGMRGAPAQKGERAGPDSTVESRNEKNRAPGG